MKAAIVIYILSVLGALGIALSILLPRYPRRLLDKAFPRWYVEGAATLLMVVAITLLVALVMVLNVNF